MLLLLVYRKIYLRTTELILVLKFSQSSHLVGRDPQRNPDSLAAICKAQVKRPLYHFGLGCHKGSNNQSLNRTEIYFFAHVKKVHQQVDESYIVVPQPSVTWAPSLCVSVHLLARGCHPQTHSSQYGHQSSLYHVHFLGSRKKEGQDKNGAPPV